MFLTDEKIVQAINNGDIIIENLDDVGAYSRVISPTRTELQHSKLIQPCSIDLSIGHIFIPPLDPRNGDETAHVDFVTGHSLQPGETAVAQTKERLTLSKSFGAFGFPPAGVSKNSILMTNPGHVDPGYSGHLTFTLINMGRKPFELKRGERIASLLLFQLPEEVAFGYSERNPASSPNWVKLLNHLSPDFGALQTKMAKAAASAVSEKTVDFDNKINKIGQGITIAQIMIPLASAAIVAIFGYISTVGDYVKSSQLSDIRNSIAKLEARSGIVDIEKQISDMQKRLTQLDATVSKKEQGK